MITIISIHITNQMSSRNFKFLGNAVIVGRNQLLYDETD